MSNRSALVLVLSLAAAPAVYAADQTIVEPIQVAQATTIAGQATSPAQAAPTAAHGTQRGVLAAAEQGPDALRRYVDRTRMIYAYRFEDFAKADWYR